MSKRNQTYTIGVAAAYITLPTDRDVYLSVKSHKANTGTIWISEAVDVNDTTQTTVAVAQADEMMLIEPGEAVLIRRVADRMSAISTVAAQLITVSVAVDRVR